LTRLDKLSLGFQSSLKRLNRKCVRADTLLRNGLVTISDCDLIYEATFLTGVAALEHFFEAALIEMIWMGKGSMPHNRAVITATSRDAIRRLILLGREYGEFMPLGKAIDRARLFLSSPVPFASFSQSDKDLLTPVNVRAQRYRTSE
jgi:hypothetical protein